jgi:hypothetical protein
MHDVGLAEEFCATVATELVACDIVLGAAVPTMLVAFMVSDQVGMFLRSFFQYLGNFVASG